MGLKVGTALSVPTSRLIVEPLFIVSKAPLVKVPVVSISVDPVPNAVAWVSVTAFVLLMLTDPPDVRAAGRPVPVFIAVPETCV